MRLLIFFVSILFLTPLYSHCQLPCGIYHDDLEFMLLEEYTETLRRANKGILTNTDASAQGDNQMVRWVNLKDEYADKISTLMTTYFLQQRIQPEQEDLVDLLKVVHQILRTAMKVKQTVDQNIVKQLECEITNFKTLYQPPVKE